MLTIRSADDLTAHLAPRAVEYFEVSARRKDPGETSEQATFAVETTPFVRVRDGEGLDVRLRITGDAPPFEAITEMAVLFDFTEELEISEEVEQVFLLGRGFEIAYPYAKEAFEQAIARIGFPVLLPVMPTMRGQLEQADRP